MKNFKVVVITQILLLVVIFNTMNRATSPIEYMQVQQDSFYTLKIIIENVYDSSFLYQINIIGSNGSSIESKISSTNACLVITLKYDVDYSILIHSRFHLVCAFTLSNKRKKKYIEKKINLIELHNPDQIRHQDTDYIYFGED